MKCERDLSKKKNIKTMNGEMTTNSQLSTTKPQNKNKLMKQPEQEQDHRNGDHMESCSREKEKGKWGKRYMELEA